MKEIPISKIKYFGSLGYSPDAIADYFNLKGKERIELILRLGIRTDEYYLAYKNGQSDGEYKVDAELSKKAEEGDPEAIELLAERSKERKRRDLKKEMFGI